MAQRPKGVGNRQPAPILIPPQGFLTIEPNLHRALEPILSEHLLYLKRLKIGVILVVNNLPLNDVILSFVDENEGIAIHSIASDSSPFLSNIHLSEDWIKHALELLLSFGQETVLLLGRSSYIPSFPSLYRYLLPPSADTCIDALIIGCLRKLQKWDMTSILFEFRHLTGRKIFDMEQFIEFIDIKQTRLPRRWLPNYIECYLELEEEEFSAVLEESQLFKTPIPILKNCRSSSFEDDSAEIGMPLSPDPISDQQHRHRASQTQSQSQMTSEPLPESLSSQPNDAMSSATSESLSLSLPPNLDSQAQQREYLLSLLFEKANQCISSSAQYDPSLSLITEDTADD